MVAAKEGWGVIRPGDRKAHYYVDAFSLCGRVGFYSGSLDVLDAPSPDDCAVCRKLRNHARYPLTKGEGRVLTEALGRDGWLDATTHLDAKALRVQDALLNLGYARYEDQNNRTIARITEVGREALVVHGYLTVPKEN